MELLLINHPLDCPVCDKGGECPLQNQAMSNGRGASRGSTDVKRTFPKPINISRQVLLDRERCVLCARCTRFSAQVAGDPFIEMLERGALQQVGIYEAEPFESYFSGNTVQICPVGALTGAAYRFRSRPFDLVSSPGVCEHCASGLRDPHRPPARQGPAPAGRRRPARSTRSGTATRAAGRSSTPPRRTGSRTPLVRDDDGELVPTSWAEALDIAARGPGRGRAAPPASWSAGAPPSRTPTPTRSSPGWRSAPTTSTSAPGRTRPRRRRSWPRTSPGTGLGVTYADLEHAPAVLLVGLEPEEESPIVFLRLRKAVAQGGLAVHAVAPFASRGLEKLSGTLLADRARAPRPRCSTRSPRATTDVGRRGRRCCAAPAPSSWSASGSAAVPGALSARRRARRARPAPGWPGCPRRAGERGALEAGALPDPAARRPSGGRRRGARRRRHRLGRRRTCRERPAATPTAILAAACTRASSARWSSAASTRTTCPTRPPRCAALDAAPFVVSLELRAVGGDRAGRRRAARSPRPSRRPARSSTGRAATGPFARGPARHQRDARRPGAARARRRDGRRPRAARRRRPRAAEIAELGLLGRRPRRRRRRSPPPTPPRRRPPARPCSRPGASCSTPAGCRTASRSSPAPPAPRSPGSPPATAAELGVADGDAVDRRAPTRGAVTAAGASSPRCPTASSGCPPTPPGCRCATRSAPAPAPWSGSPRRRERPGGARMTACRRARVARGAGLRHRPVVAGRSRKAVVDLRVPRRDDAVHDLVRAPGRRPDAAPHRPQPGRPAGPAAEPRRRHQAGAEGGHHPEGRRQGRSSSSRRSSRRRRRSWRSR